MIHRLTVRVYFEDTDFSGFAYHGSYVRFMERGRTELVRSLAVSQADLFERERFAFVVRRMTIDFRKPARMDDELSVVTKVIELRGATLRLAQAIMRRDETLVTTEVLVAATREGRATRIPDSIRSAMEGE
ncbi:MAG TPA: tol-pal system-associated acyl-CoA thioesterase [Microvirga sp.]|nr:tol-pal system-associated acyl-CoA thioesterase [Microvirga sp.]